MDGQYTKAHNIDNEEKKSRYITMLLQIHEWNAATESAHTEAGDKEFQTRTDLTKKRKLMCINVR